MALTILTVLNKILKTMFLFNVISNFELKFIFLHINLHAKRVYCKKKIL